MKVQSATGETFEVQTSMIDVTSASRPDLSWRYVDRNGHEHSWRLSSALGTPAAGAYSPSKDYVLSSLVCVSDGFTYYEDGERTEDWHYECLLCREVVKPGTCADTHTQYMPGLRSYLINGETVSREEFERRAREAGLPV